MKAEIIASMEQLLKAEDVLTVQKEFNRLSTQYKALIAEERKEHEMADDDDDEDQDHDHDEEMQVSEKASSIDSAKSETPTNSDSSKTVNSDEVANASPYIPTDTAEDQANPTESTDKKALERSQEPESAEKPNTNSELSESTKDESKDLPEPSSVAAEDSKSEGAKLAEGERDVDMQLSENSIPADHSEKSDSAKDAKPEDVASASPYISTDADDSDLSTESRTTATKSDQSDEKPEVESGIEEQEEKNAIKSGDATESVETSDQKSEDTAEQVDSSQTEDANSSADSSETDSDSTASNEENTDDLKSRYEEIVKAFRSQVAAARETKKKIEADTIAKAKALLEELQGLVENEENIGKAFSGFNAIQEHWRNLPKVSNDDYRDLNAEYNKQVERFFYNINIYKELKELDLKHNLDEKLKVLEDQKKLLEVKDIRLLEVEVRMNQDRWNDIGPTFKEEWDKLKDEFWSVTRNIYKRVQDFYNERREEMDRNFDLKQALLEKVQKINEFDLHSNKKWQEKTNEVIEIQKEWKLIGYVPKEKSSALWKSFRTTCDAFFEKKRLHYGEIHKQHDANKTAKEKLVIQSEALKDSQEWQETASVLIQLQKDWKKIGPAHQRDDNALWGRFRQACNHFFNAKNEQRAEENVHQKENLVQKEALINEIKAFESNENQTENLKQLKEFSEKWRAIGHVPFKSKDGINKDYKDAMDEKFNSVNIDRRERQKMRFEEKVDIIKDASSSDRLVRKERDFIRGKISKLESEIKQYENNMGFFANSKGADKLKEEVERKIDKAKAEVDTLYEQLQILDEVV